MSLYLINSILVKYTVRKRNRAELFYAVTGRSQAGFYLKMYVQYIMDGTVLVVLDQVHNNNKKYSKLNSLIYVPTVSF